MGCALLQHLGGERQAVAADPRARLAVTAARRRNTSGRVDERVGWRCAPGAERTAGAASVPSAQAHRRGLPRRLRSAGVERAADLHARRADVGTGPGNRTHGLGTSSAEVADRKRTCLLQRALAGGRSDDLMYTLVTEADRRGYVADRDAGGVEPTDRVLVGEARPVGSQLAPEGTLAQATRLDDQAVHHIPVYLHRRGCYTAARRSGLRAAFSRGSW